MQENQEPVTQVNQLPSLPTQAGKSNNFLIILLSILLIISVVIAGFFAYQTQQLVKQLTVYRLQPTQTSTPIATTEPTLKPITDLEQIKDFVATYLVSSGYKKENLIISDPILLGSHQDKYSVGWSLKDDNTAHGGTWLLVGKANGNWIIPNDGDSNYCNWIKTAELDEVTQEFMGSTCKL